MISDFLARELDLIQSEEIPKFTRPPVFESVLSSSIRYAIFKGGRGSTKSLSVFTWSLEESYKDNYKNKTILVLREVNRNLDDVRDTYLDLIAQAGAESDFRAGKNGSIINKRTKCKIEFRGARTTEGKTKKSQANKLKGIHNVAVVIFEEAQDISEETLNTLLPTVARQGTARIEGKESQKKDAVRFIGMMNPILRKDPIIKKFETFDDCMILHVNIFDVPKEFQDAELLEQAESEKDTANYGHIWLGEPYQNIGGFPFSDLEQIETEEEFESFAFLDPSFNGGDYTALSFIAVKNGKLLIWGYCWRAPWNRCIDKIVSALREHNAQEFAFESNNIFSAGQDRFEQAGINAMPFLSVGEKHSRIYRAISEIEQYAQIVTNKCNSEFLNNLLEYNINAANDDAADSVASNLIYQQIVQKRNKTKK